MMQIRKSEIRKAVQEHLQVWMSNDKPLGMISMRGSIEPADREDIEVDNEALDDAIKETLKHLEADATLRMQAESAGVSNTADVEKENFHNSIKGAIRKVMVEISGVDSLKPNDPHTPEDEAEKDAADDVMEQGDRPRGGPHIENVRFWKLDEKSLRYIIKDASEAVKTNPMARKASKWADEVNDAVTVLHWRKKKGIKEGTWAMPDTQKKYDELMKLMKRPLILGKDAEQATKKLSNLVGDDDLFDDLGDASDKNPKGDARPYIKKFLKSPSVKQYLKQKKIKESFNTAPAGQGKRQASVIDTDEAKEVGSLASSPKSKEIIKKMQALVTKKLKFKTVEDIQPIKDGVAFIFGDKAEASKMAAYLKKAGALGRVIPLARGGRKRTMVSLKHQPLNRLFLTF